MAIGLTAPSAMMNKPGFFIDSPDQAEAPHLRQFLATWQSLRGGRTMPAKCDIKPDTIVPALSSLAIVAVEGIADPMDYWFRLSGTTNDEISQIAFTNKRFREVLHPETAQVIIDEYQLTIETRRPRLSFGSLDAQKRGHVRFERLLAPVGKNGETVDHVFTVFGFSAPHL